MITTKQLRAALARHRDDTVKCVTMLDEGQDLRDVCAAALIGITEMEGVLKSFIKQEALPDKEA